MSKAINDFAEAVLASIAHEMFGIGRITRLSLVALFTGGHILLEGNPGLGKTELVKTLGRVMRLPFGRIQFTPDLMPADITGTYMPDFETLGSRGLAFRPGPIFTSLLLADEINRATPKTQSAMLEAMAEKQVTVLGEVRHLAEPFMVLATQNPIDQEGTYNLPEAQADRFMFKAVMPIPDASVMRAIMRKRAGIGAQQTQARPAPPQSALLPVDGDDATRKYMELRKLVETVTPLPSLESHIVNMFLASNGRFSELEGLDRKQVDRLQRLVSELVTYGLGPRAGITLMLGAKAWSLLFARGAAYAEGASLANVVLPTLRHRLKLGLDWDERYRTMVAVAPSTEQQLLKKMLADFCVHCAPRAGEYQTTVKGAPALADFVKGERW